MFTLTAKGNDSGIELLLCTDGKWRHVTSFADNARLFSTVKAAEQHGQQLHEEGRLTHWTFIVTGEKGERV